jgi:hypothetical protein
MFNGRITPIEDYDRWLRIAILYEVDYVDRPLVRFRDHVACFRKDKVVTIQNIINTLNGIFNEYPQMRLTEKEKIDRKLSCLYVDLSKAYLWRFGLRQAFLSCSSACKLTKAPLLPFYVLFSFFVDYLKQPLRFLRLKFKRILAGH